MLLKPLPITQEPVRGYSPKPGDPESPERSNP